jgi:hypothetical protein
MNAWKNAHLYHVTDVSGRWQKEVIHNYDMAYTYEQYIKSSIRQDIEVDDRGHLQVVFGEQIAGTDDPSRLRYTTNATGVWEIETALSNDHGSKDDAGWFPSLALDASGTPHVVCSYINRVQTYSANYSRLLFLTRLGRGNWRSEVIADRDDGYYGGDGRSYTGALAHLVFDENNRPRVVFSDIASTHWPYQRLNVGNIRYGVPGGDGWRTRTLYRQPLPTSFTQATEMHGLILLLPEQGNTVRVVGQELQIRSETDYSCRLLELPWDQ